MADPCAVHRAANRAIQENFQQQNWQAVIRLAEKLPALTPDDRFALGMAQAHLGRLADAERALRAGERQCPQDKRFPTELAGVAFEQKRYAAAAHWLRRAQHLDPADAYVSNFLGTVYFLSGNLDAALPAWNRIHKPMIDNLDLDPHLRVNHLLLERAFTFSPHEVLEAPQFATTALRLDGLGIFPAWSLHLNALPNGQFNAIFRAQEQNGLGASPLEAAVSTLGGLPYETIYPSYANIHHSAMNVESLLRWDAQKRRAWIALSAPLNHLPWWRWQMSADLRNENWAIRRSFTGPAPLLAALNLERESFDATLTSLSTARLQWSAGGELAHRNFRSVVPGTALTAPLLTSGFELRQLASVRAPLLRLPEHRFTLDGSASSGFARTFSSPSYASETLQGSALADWLPQMDGDRYELRQQLRGGRIFGTVPFDDLFLFGMDRDDTNLYLRAHIATRDGRKGSAPIGNGYLLSNTDFYRRLYTNGLLTIHAGPLLDIGRMTAPTSGLSAQQWLFDAGAEVRLTILHTSVVLSYGRDLRAGANAFYGAAAPPTMTLP
ncbi:MAG: tetratricopeptide repeat protein [Acidobacteriaceae bacterium]